MIKKYGNKKVEFDGFKFDSKKEFKRYQTLKMMQQAKLISELQMQVPFVLANAVVLGGRKKPDIRYVADFVYIKDGVKVVEDVKSAATKTLPVYRIKKHLMKLVHNIEITEI